MKNDNGLKALFWMLLLACCSAHGTGGNPLDTCFGFKRHCNHVWLD